MYVTALQEFQSETVQDGILSPQTAPSDNGVYNNLKEGQRISPTPPADDHLLMYATGL